ncbi:two-component system, OmpR family, KDP operon response regulator KdpE [Hafnia alvei]|uniref:Two-component system, OmpR family, KDP operon response regulator KdpE n=1 Tax=Hafnia alvei TaxID=569 RepID=A0A1C6YZW5_HAFAL|nr:two-component system, OmpR family, KDP operon response regulator KdpE [Hafnia alvei]
MIIQVLEKQRAAKQRDNVNQTPINVLIVEDEKEIRRFVRSALENEGWRVFDADTLQRGLIEAGTRKPDLIILDLGLPDGDGLDFIRDLRQWSSIPVIVLSARSEESDKVLALDAGADDYLSKPFGVAELLARVRVSLRRHAQQNQESPLIQFSDVEVDLINRRVTRAGEDLHLTPLEFRLLTELIANAGKVLTQRQLLSTVWGPNYVEHSHYLRIYMGHLRQKLEAEPARPKHLLTETGVGYRFML